LRRKLLLGILILLCCVASAEAIAVQPSAGGAGITSALKSGNVELSPGVYYCSGDINVPSGRTLTGVYDAADPRNPAKNSILYFESPGTVSPQGDNTLSKFSIIGAGYILILNANNINCEDLYITHRDLNGNSQPNKHIIAAFWCVARDNDISNIRYNRCVAEHVNGHGWQHDDRVGGTAPSAEFHWIRGLTITNCRASYTGDAYLLSGGAQGWPWDGAGFTIQERNRLADAYIANCVADHTLISGFHQEGAGMFGGISGARNITIENCRADYSGTKGSMSANPYKRGDSLQSGDWWTFGGFTVTANTVVRDCSAKGGWMNFMGWWSQNVVVERFHSSDSIGAGYLLVMESGYNMQNKFIDCVSENDGKCALDLYAGSNNVFDNFVIEDCRATSGWQILANGCTDAGNWGSLYAYPYTNQVNCHIIGGGSQIAKCSDSRSGSVLKLSGDAIGTGSTSFSGAVDSSAFRTLSGPVPTPTPTPRPTATPTPTPTPTPTGRPDLVVTDISWEPANPTPGSAVTLKATIKNQGTAATPAGVIHGVFFTFDDGAAGPSVWSDSHTASLAPGASVTLTANGGPAGSIWTAVEGTHTVKAHVDDMERMVESDENNNILTAPITVSRAVPTPTPTATPTPTPTVTPTPTPAGRPDLVVTDISWEPANPTPGSAVTLKATIKNQGTAATPAGVIHGVFFTFDDGAAGPSVWSDSHTASLAPGASVTLTANGGPAGSIWTAVEGTHTVKAHVDDMERMVESDENNNILTAPITVSRAVPTPTPTATPTPTPTVTPTPTPAGRPDLVVTDISWEPANPTPGSAVTLKATIKNQGTAATPASVIHGVFFTFDDGAAGPSVWSDSHTASLAPGAWVTLTANGGPAGSIWTAVEGVHTVKAHVDDMERMVESDENNNILQKTISIRSR